MDTIDREAYIIVFNELYNRLTKEVIKFDHALTRAEQIVPFEYVSGFIFLSGMFAYVRHSLVLPADNATAFIVLCGIGCILATVALLYGAGGVLRWIQGISCLSANALMMVLLSFPEG